MILLMYIIYIIIIILSGFLALQCHYGVLGVSKKATRKEIRAAYLQKTKEVTHEHFDEHASSLFSNEI